MNIETIKSVYFVGAGGIGMSALVRYFLSKGKVVAGYDRTPTPLTENLIAEGAQRKRPTDSGSLQRQRKHFSRIDSRRSAGTRRIGLFPQQRIRNTKTRASTGNDHSFQQRSVCSRHSWQDDHFYHDRPPIPPIAHRMYRFPWRHLQELRHQSAALSEKPLYRHRSRRVRPLFPLAVPLYVCHHCHRPRSSGHLRNRKGIPRKLRTLYNTDPAGRCTDYPQRYLTATESTSRSPCLYLFA